MEKNQEVLVVVSFDYTALKTRIKERFGTYHAFAAALGVSDKTLYRWLNNETPMSIGSLRRMVEYLEIPAGEIDYFFFRLRPPSEIPHELEAKIQQMDGAKLDLLMRYINCLISIVLFHLGKTKHISVLLKNRASTAPALSLYHDQSITAFSRLQNTNYRRYIAAAKW